MKTCTRCKETRPKSQFHKRLRARDGLQPWCKSCSNQARVDAYKKNPRTDRKYSSKRVSDWLSRTREYLADTGCVDCGEKDWFVLEFDHVRGKKDSEVSIMVRNGRAWDSIQAEIDKCEVRCANCHRRRHHYERLEGALGA